MVYKVHFGLHFNAFYKKKNKNNTILIKKIHSSEKYINQ